MRDLPRIPFLFGRSGAQIAFVLMSAVPPPVGADVILLKGGQRIEGEVQSRGGGVEVKTEYGVLTVPKGEVKKTIRNPEAVIQESESLYEKAKTLYQAALGVSGNPSSANTNLQEAVGLIDRAIDLCQEAREVYTDEKYEDLDQKCILFMQHKRLCRERMTSAEPVRAAAPVPAAGRKEPVEAPPAAAKAPASSPATPAPEPPKTARATVDVAALTAKAKGGDVEAMYALGAHFEDVGGNFVEAQKWYKSAAGKNHPRAASRLGRLSMDGEGGVRIDYAEAQKWFLKGHEKGCALAQYNLGVLQYEGKSGLRNLKKAGEWCDKAALQLRFAADAGDPESQCALGWMHAKGMGVDLDEAKAAEYYRRAAEQGYAEGKIRLGGLFESGKGVSKDLAAAAELYKSAADQGNPRGQVLYGDMLRSARGVKEEPQKELKAQEWMRKAAEQGSAYGRYAYGRSLFHGNGAVKDVEAGLKWLRLSAQQGSIEAMNQLGLIYTKGYGITVNPEEAVKWYLPAAKLGDTIAQYGMANYLENKEKFKESLEWLRLAATNGHAGSMEKIGYHYETGKGVPKSLELAKFWYVTAAQKGSSSAASRLKSIGTK